MVIEIIPLAIDVVLGYRSVMPTVQSSCMVHYCEQVVELVIGLGWDHEVLHVQAFDWIVDWRVLLLIRHVAFEPLQGYYQDWWRLVDLDLFYCLFMLLALVAVPFVLPAQLLWRVELSEAVGYCYLVDEQVVFLYLFCLAVLLILALGQFQFLDRVDEG